MDYEKLLRQYRKKPLTGIEEIACKLDLGRDEIKMIIPHRAPFLLVDRLTGIDLEEGLITGSRYIEADDPLFQGHFPDYPVYPGSLEIEMIGQLGLCLHYFLTNETTVIRENARPVPVRATRVVGAYFLEPLLPGREVVLIAKKLEHDGFFATMIGQAVADRKICCVAAAEVCFLD